MRINEIRKDAADYAEYPDKSDPTKRFHELSTQVVTARDICQYGHMDDFSFGSALWHKYKASTNPEGYLYETCKQVYDDVTSMDAGTDKTCMEAGPEV